MFYKNVAYTNRRNKQKEQYKIGRTRMVILIEKQNEKKREQNRGKTYTKLKKQTRF